MSKFWRITLAIITGNIGLFMIICALTYMPAGYAALTFIYGMSIEILSIMEIAFQVLD